MSLFPGSRVSNQTKWRDQLNNSQDGHTKFKQCFQAFPENLFNTVRNLQMVPWGLQDVRTSLKMDAGGSCEVSTRHHDVTSQKKNTFQTHTQFYVTDDRLWVYERLTSIYLTQLFQLVALLSDHIGEQ